MSWDTIIGHRETGAWIAGNSCAAYLSDAADGDPGFTGPLYDPDTTVSLFRLINGGASLQRMQRKYAETPGFEEIDDYDFQNLSVVGHGAIVYADSTSFSLDGSGVWELPFESSLWKTTDGGDGTLSAAMLAPQLALGHSSFTSSTDTLTISECASSTMEVYNQNIGCSSGNFDSISIVGLQRSEYSILSTKHCSCQPMPDTSLITLMPQDTGTRTVVIHYHFTDDEFNQIDTSIQFILDVQPGSTSVPLTLSFQSPTMSATPGDTISVPVYLNGTASLGATSITLPFGVDTNILVPIGFQPAMNGLTVDSSFYSGGTETVSLQSSELTLNGETLIGYLRCIVYLTDTLSSVVTLPGASLTSSQSPCVALSLALDSLTVNIVGCGTKTLQQFMLTGQVPPFAIQRIVPNPAQNEITIVGGSGTFTISDPLGRVALRQSPSPNPLPEGEDYMIDISSLSSGVYFMSDGISGVKFVKE